MWIELGKGFLTFVLGLGSGVFLMFIKERRDKKGQLEAEQRQILTELLTTLSDAKRVSPPIIGFQPLALEH